jgi:general stress protein 26
MAQQAGILEAAANAVHQHYVGLLCTVDAHDRPHARYMAGVCEDEDLSRLYALTAKETDKVQHLAQNHHVCWVFSDIQAHQVITLYGTAATAATTDLPLDVWNRLIDSATPYAMHASSDPSHHAFTAVVTRVQEVSYLSPAEGLYQPKVVRLD